MSKNLIQKLIIIGLSVAVVGAMALPIIMGAGGQSGGSYDILSWKSSRKASTSVSATPNRTIAYAPSTSSATSSASCVWLGHCLGDPCQTLDDCDGALVCSSGACGPVGGGSTPAATTPTAPTTTAPTTTATTTSSASCVWLGHCAGAACTTYDDCDGDLVCNSGVCGPIGGGSASTPIVTTPTTTATPPTTTTTTPPPATTTTATTTTVPATTPSTGKIWGAYLSDNNASAFESLVGSKMDIQAYFYGWGDSFPSNSALKGQGKTLAIFWEQYNTTLDNIISGGPDSYIKQFAASAKSYGGPVLLMPFHEMNGNWDPWDGTVGSNTPAKVVSAWKHVYDLFAGVTNVKFVWAVNNDSVPNTSANAIANYYPGASYVDYVGIDGFNFGDQWTFNSVFSSALSQVRGYNKPILISSTASAAGSQKASFITDSLTKMKNDSGIAGFIWFNENKEENWLVNSDAASLQAFKTGIASW